MYRCGERKKGPIHPDFNRSIKMHFQGATLSSDTGFLLLREIDERFGVFEAMGETLEDNRSLCANDSETPTP